MVVVSLVLAPASCTLLLLQFYLVHASPLFIATLNCMKLDAKGRTKTGMRRTES